MEGGEGGSASWTMVLQVIGLQIRRVFLSYSSLEQTGPHRCYGLMCFEQAVYFPASWVLTAEQGLPAGSRITLWKAGDKTDHTECLGLGDASGEHAVQPPAKAGSPTAGCTGLCPGGFRIAPDRSVQQMGSDSWERQLALVGARLSQLQVPPVLGEVFASRAQGFARH